MVTKINIKTEIPTLYKISKLFTNPTVSTKYNHVFLNFDVVYNLNYNT